MPNEIVVSQQTEVQTMTSLEIAELTGKEHKHVIRDIKKMLAALQKDASDLRYEQIQGVTEYSPNLGATPAGVELIDYVAANGKSNPMFRLNEQYTVCLVTGYDVPARMRVITKVDELKAKLVALPAAPQANLVPFLESQSAQITELLAQQSRLIAILEAKYTAPVSKPVALKELPKVVALPTPKPVTEHITCAHWLNRNNIKIDDKLKAKLCANVAAYYVSRDKPFKRTRNDYGLFTAEQIERQYHLLVTAKQTELSF